MRKLRTTMLLIGAGSSLGLVACEEPASGECEGQIDPNGEVFNLRIYNCTRGEMIVKVNGRSVGTVEGYRDEEDECPGTDLGSFPQCSEGEISAYGYASVTETIIWSEDAVNLNGPGCWVVARVVGADVPLEDAEPEDLEPAISSSEECKYLEIDEDF